MNIKKWAITAGAVLACGGLLTGVAFASGTGAKLSEKLQEAVKAGKMTQGQADVMTQLGDLRKAQMEKLQADAKALIEQAVKDGRITQEQADKLLKHDKGMAMGLEHRGFKGSPMGDHKWSKSKPLTQDELKAKLDAAVKAGKMTQEQANKALERWSQHGEKTK